MDFESNREQSGVRRPHRRTLVQTDRFESASDCEDTLEKAFRRSATLGTDPLSPSSDGAFDTSESTGLDRTVRFADELGKPMCSMHSDRDWFNELMQGDNASAVSLGNVIDVLVWKEFRQRMTEGVEMSMTTPSRLPSKEKSVLFLSQDELESLTWVYQGANGETRACRIPVRYITEVRNLRPHANGSGKAPKSGDFGSVTGVRFKLKWKAGRHGRQVKSKAIFESKVVPATFVSCLKQLVEYINPSNPK